MAEDGIVLGGRGVEDCDHSLRVGTLCACCGKEVGRDENVVAALHTSDVLVETVETAKEKQRERNRFLDGERKLILVLDLDQTILHASSREIDCDYVFALDGVLFYVKYRPHVRFFLKKAKRLFEIHVYTMGSRAYAQKVCGFIDPDGEIFGNRIVSRSENFNELTKSIKRITPISKNVVILDDRIDVWGYIHNIILIRPFWYCNNIDINDPARLRGNRPNKADKEEAGISEKIMKEASHDRELMRVYKIMKRVHAKYFKRRCSVARILRLCILKGSRVLASPRIAPLVGYLGGEVVESGADFAIEDREGAMACNIRNVGIRWLYECIYRRKSVEIEGYVKGDYRGPVDAYEAELLDEFFD